jgi:hypothetical protein
MDVLGIFGGMILLGAIIIAISIAIIFLVIWMLGLPNIPMNERIRKRLSELKSTGFTSTYEHIRGGAGVAVDGSKKQVFLANAQGMTLYNIADVTKVESQGRGTLNPKKPQDARPPRECERRICS